MKVLYSGLKFHKYNSKGGFSPEYVIFYEGLKAMPGVELIYLPFDRILEVGKKRFNEEILEAAKRENPDIFVAYMLSDELDKKMLLELKKQTTTLAWFADDSWRFWNYSRFWAPYFTWVSTTYSWTPALFKKYSQPNVIRSQWGVNPFIFKPSGNQANIDVSFVGTWSKPRVEIIQAVRKAGIKVDVYGAGWPESRRISDEEMIKIFSESKINLSLNPPPGYFNLNSLGRLLLRRSVNKFVPDLHLYSNVRSWLSRGIPQIKARHFEIPACGGFQITSMADDLGNFYKIGEEIVVYDGIIDLIRKIKYYLNHNEEREKIARAGYERTITDHTYQKRFAAIFSQIFK